MLSGLLVFFFFFLASARAAGPLDAATLAAVVDLIAVSLGSLLAVEGSADIRAVLRRGGGSFVFKGSGGPC